MTTLGTEVESALLSAAASILTVWIALRRGFFTPPQGAIPVKHPPTLLVVLCAFALYFAAGILIPTLFSTYFIQNFSPGIPIAGFSLLSFLTASAILLALYAWFFTRPATMRQTIWLRRGDVRIGSDIGFGLLTWLISFPIVVFIGSLLEIAIYLLFNTFDLPDQVVINFLKMTFGHPFYLLLTILSIVVFAPLIEELLFRGFLQSYLRKYFGPSFSIFLSSLCFTLFHFAKDQGLGNISILGSLFVLACFLGYLYERQGSLLSTITLHATFNTISVANLYFFNQT